MSHPTLDWNSIRPLNGDRAKGFEELCAQLARVEAPVDARFERKGTPDAGVECYAVLDNGKEWGWQSKYFDGLGTSQWAQLDESIKTAITKHPQLIRYFVCVPIDRPDARIDGQKSAMDRWEEHVAKWTGWANVRGMAVEFTYWGSHELLNMLSAPKHVGRVAFWFDARKFDNTWFERRMGESVSTAGPRYTPEIHIDLPIAAEFEAFGRTDLFFNGIKSLAREIRRKFQQWDSGCRSLPSDPSLNDAVVGVRSSIQAVLAQFAVLRVQPIGPLPLREIVSEIAAAETAAQHAGQLFSDRETQWEHANKASSSAVLDSHSRRNPFSDCRTRIRNLTWEIQSAGDVLASHLKGVGAGQLMLLYGNAGVGKTHLLCDIARKRIQEGRPTVLLMGQRFSTSDTPWVQVRNHLDLGGMSEEEFVGALESAAQVSGGRAMVLIDAINEGTGQIIWPIHLAVFLAHIERSPWIGVVLSVRSSYEKKVIPDPSLRSKFAAVEHHGFSSHEYSAIRTFFGHYKLELPSTPLLTPEFSRPLFLKTLCIGLSESGMQRLPRGLHGITAIFGLYLDAVNKHLASVLDFDQRDRLVQKSLAAMCEASLEGGVRWLALDQAKDVVNKLLPGRNFGESLYRHLVVEGLLVEDIGQQDGADQDIVYISYERFADHLCAKMLLDRHLDSSKPDQAFSKDGALAFLCDTEKRIPPGLLEAMCVQLPERTSREFPVLAPSIIGHWGIGSAFRQSLVWRSSSAFTRETRKLLHTIDQGDHRYQDTLDVFLTVSVIPDHPLNAEFLDGLLKKYTMPERDAWWSIDLHHMQGQQGAVDRIIDWASSVNPSMVLDEDAVDLCAVTLAWMFTTSNRFLRDRATKALVNLLAGRMDSCARLIEKFVDVDDPYVAERVYAVVYGVTMRCHDPVAAGKLSESVYRHVFESGNPPPQILLRDYARGIVERAIHLGSKISIVEARIRPPYSSSWPVIPSEEDIKPLLADWSSGSYDSGDPGWSKNSIGSSVMYGDFARYVIGTNSATINWLSLRHSEPAWKHPDELLRDLLSEFSIDEQAAWKNYEAADKKYGYAHRVAIDRILQDIIKSHPHILDGLDEVDGAKESIGASKLEEVFASVEEPSIPETAIKDDALKSLHAVLTPEHVRRLEEVLALKEDRDTRRAPRFDLTQIQRYVLQRVFSLGWTVDRFGIFDRCSADYHGRSAAKPERIGKKYQWIAYHEIMALVADNFQYREQYREDDGDRTYEGPWQGHWRDIDPSCPLQSVRNKSSALTKSHAWWDAVQYANWRKPDAPRDWVLCSDDLPRPEPLLCVVNHQDGTRWVNMQGYFSWRESPPPDQDPVDVERRELWVKCTGYLIRENDAQQFLNWSADVNFFNQQMPDMPAVSDMFLGEYGWAPASLYFQKPYFGDTGWAQPGQGCPVEIRPLAVEYSSESGGFDCSIEESRSLRLPTHDLVPGLKIRWSGVGANFVDRDGRTALFDPTRGADDPEAMLVREEILRQFLVKEKYAICWVVIGEKRILMPGFGPAGPVYPIQQFSGAYLFDAAGLRGSLKTTISARRE